MAARRAIIASVPVRCSLWPPLTTLPSELSICTGSLPAEISTLNILGDRPVMSELLEQQLSALLGCLQIRDFLFLFFKPVF